MLAGATALLCAGFWFVPYPQLSWPQWSFEALLPALPTRTTAPQEPAPVVRREAVPPVSALTPPPSPPEPLRSERVPPAPEVSEALPVATATYRTVKKGDQLAKVAVEVYGFSNNAVLEWIKKNNPQLRDPNRMDVGMQLTFPPLPAGTR